MKQVNGIQPVTLKPARRMLTRLHRFRLPHSVTKLLAFFPIALSIATAPSFAAQHAKAARKMSLKEAVMLGMRMNPSVRSGIIGEVASKFALAVARNEFEVRYNLTGTGSYTRSGSNNEPIEHSQSYSLAPVARLKNKWGTTYALTWDNAYTDSQGQPNSYNPGLTLKITQPLLRGAGKSFVTSTLDSAVLNRLSDHFSFTNTLITQIGTIEQNYRQVVSQLATVAINRLALKNAKESLWESTQKVKAGQAAPASLDDLKTTVFQDQLNLVSAENTLRENKKTLLTSLGLDPYANIDVDTDISIKGYKIPTVKEATALALKNNINYQTSLIGLAQAKISLLQALNGAKWQLDLTATAVMGNGSGPGNNANFYSLTNGANQSQTVGLALTVPIDDMAIKNTLLTARTGLAQKEIAAQQAKWQLETNVINVINRLQTDKQQILLAKETLKYAERSYRVTRKRVAVGQATTFELTQKATDLTTDQQAVVNNEISFLNDYTSYEALVAQTLKHWGLQTYG